MGCSTNAGFGRSQEMAKWTLSRFVYLADPRPIRLSLDLEEMVAVRLIRATVAEPHRRIPWHVPADEKMPERFPVPAFVSQLISDFSICLLINDAGAGHGPGALTGAAAQRARPHLVYRAGRQAGERDGARLRGEHRRRPRAGAGADLHLVFPSRSSRFPSLPRILPSRSSRLPSPSRILPSRSPRFPSSSQIFPSRSSRFPSRRQKYDSVG